MTANSSTSSMICLEDRQSSFLEITKPKSKAKPAFPLSASTYPYLTPKALSQAGFFHKPGDDDDSLDTCQCFLCGLKLGGWDEDDDPFEEHVKRHTCAWAEFICQPKLNRRKNIKGMYETEASLPSSAESSKYREQTYAKWWPHKQKSGWLPTVKNLAKAGFVYSPSTESKDLVICPLCEYAVEGWEADDDPTGIHYKKSPGCEFFTAEVIGAQGRNQAQSSSRTVRSVSKSRSKRGGTAASASIPPEASSDAEASQANKTALQASTLGKGKARQTKSRVTSRNRGQAPDISESEAEPAEQETIAEVVEPEAKPKRAAKGKKAKGKQKQKDDEITIEDGTEPEALGHSAAQSEAESQNAMEVDESKASKPPGKRKGRSKRTDKPSTLPPEEDVAIAAGTEVVPEKPKRGRKTTKAAEKSTLVGRGQPAAASTRTTRSASGKSQQSQYTEDSVDEEEEAGSAASIAEEQDENDDTVTMPESAAAIPSSPPPPKTTTKPPKSTSAKNSRKASDKLKSNEGGSTKKDSVTPAASAVSHLDKFANIPPSSPFDFTKADSSSTPRPKSTLVTSKPLKPSPRVDLPREALEKSVVDGAKEARKVMEEMLINASKEDEIKELSKEQKDMTVEEFVRGEMQKRYERMKMEGELMIAQWEEKTREARRKIEAL